MNLGRSIGYSKRCSSQIEEMFLTDRRDVPHRLHRLSPIWVFLKKSVLIREISEITLPRKSLIHPIFATQNLPMKTLFLVLVGGMILFSQTGCLKGSASQSCTPASPSSEQPSITAYASAQGINATKDSSGLYYEIISHGNGATPTADSKVFVTYVGKLLNGTVFDQQTDPDKTGWPLKSLIEGWQIGLPLIQKGGEIKLIVPSAFAYACGNGTIPPNAILYFDVHLVDVQ
jgi:FKBP-type peptidyl-prolyl cis-trans isomerase FkpA